MAIDWEDLPTTNSSNNITSGFSGWEDLPTTNSNTFKIVEPKQKPKQETVKPLENKVNPETSQPLKIEGGVSKNVRNYETRFPDRSKNFIGNAWSDTRDTVKGLASLLGGVGNFAVVRPVMNVALAEKGTPLKDRVFTGEGIEDIKNLKNVVPALKEGLKENYGQNGIDIVNWERVKQGESPIKIDLPGLFQSYYAHPLNLLDLVGAGELGKVGSVKNLTKGGKASEFAKQIGNKTVNPKYSENLVYNAGQRLAETKPVQAVVNAIDNSPFRPTTDVVADFLGLSPESRLLGTKGAEVRKTKLIEQANQVKNISERNKAIAENKANLSGLTDAEAKELVKNIESGGNEFIKPEIKYTEETAKKAQKTIQKEIKDLQTDVQPLEYVNRRYKNKFYKQNVSDEITTGLHKADIEINKITKEIADNPDIINNPEKLAEYEARVEDLASFPYEELNAPYWEQFYKSIGKADEYGTVAKELKAGQEAKIITQQSNTVLNPEQSRIKDLLQEKVNKNAKFYIEKGLLDEQTVKDLPVNTYASIKYNKPIDSLSDVEKLDALKDIEKLPKEKQPFYVPIMFDDKLRAGDFFANTTKRYKPNELKHRSVGMGAEVNKTGGQRVYDPVELANRLDAHRIKMVNTENMINEVIDNFAKPYDMAKDKILDGYVPFNPDAFLKFYRKSIDLNDLTLRKLDELQNIDTALKSSIEEAVKQLPDDIVNLLGAIKNNKIYQIPEDVAKTLMQGKNQKGIWEAMFDMGTAGFKRKVLGMSPKWFINNRIGNGIMAGLKGVNPSDYVKALKVSDELLPDALKTKSMYEAEKTIIGRTGGGDNGFFGNTMRLLGGEFIDTSELKGLQKAGVQAANTLGIPGKVVNKITDAMFGFNQKFENWERKAAYIHSANKVGKNTLKDNLSNKIMKTTGQNIVKQDELLKATLENPQVLEEVMKQVDNTLGDYINMTSVERRNLRKLIPFYSWFRTITRYTLSLAETNPIKADLTNKIAMAMFEEDDKLPEYQQGALRTNYIGEKNNKNLLLNYEHSIPFSTFGESVDNPTGLLTPFLMQPLEAARGRREFMDREFTSPSYENVFPNGYGSLKSENAGEYLSELPIGSKLGALGVGLARTSIPGLEWIERVGVGSLQNLIENGELTPKDALYDTAFGGYNYNEGFTKKPKGWSNKEQLLRTFFPIQAEGNTGRKRVKIKRQVKD